jgi:hypothetical protein
VAVVPSAVSGSASRVFFWRAHALRSKSEDFLVKTFMTCLPVTGFDESNKRKPKWVAFNNKRAKVIY